MNMYSKEAAEKLDKERDMAKASGKERAIINEVRDALKLFCEQDGEFAQAVVQTDGTLLDCCKHILKDVGNSISDLQAYQRAVQFYFPGATVKFEMRVQVNPYEGESLASGSIIDITSLL